jgi:diguanylate cyclase (GGDEF)-like protein
VVIYVDIDNFKPYNDYYSFDQGDDIIRAMSDILMHHIQSGVDFIGHIGGDDFIIVSPRVGDYEEICEGILTEFRKEIGQFYLPEDRLRRGIQALNREGQSAFFSMMSLSLGVLLVKEGVFSHQQKLACHATLAKKKAKSLGGDMFAVIDSSELS